jgi:hypothetical protein
LVYKTAREKGFTGSMDTLLDLLGNIRLGTVIEDTGKKANRKQSTSSKRWIVLKKARCRFRNHESA